MSGLSHHPGKVAQGQLCRGFESLSLRQEHHIIPLYYWLLSIDLNSDSLLDPFSFHANKHSINIILLDFLLRLNNIFTL